MSYANVAANNAPPISKQPHADTALLNTDAPAHRIGVAEDAAKVNVVGPDFKAHPVTVTSLKDPLIEAESDEEDEVATAVGKTKKASASASAAAKSKAEKTKTRAAAAAREARDVAKKDLDEAETAFARYWAYLREALLRPGVAGGLVGVVNVGLIGATSYTIYTRPSLLHTRQFLITAPLAALSLLTVEGIATNAYLATARGQAEKDRAEREGAALYAHAREAILRPGVLGGVLGALNTAVLGGVAFAAYTNWELPRWDRKVVSAVSVGLLALWGGEGIIAARYRADQHQPRRR